MWTGFCIFSACRGDLVFVRFRTPHSIHKIPTHPYTEKIPTTHHTEKNQQHTTEKYQQPTPFTEKYPTNYQKIPTLPALKKYTPSPHTKHTPTTTDQKFVNFLVSRRLASKVRNCCTTTTTPKEYQPHTHQHTEKIQPSQHRKNSNQPPAH